MLSLTPPLTNRSGHKLLLPSPWSLRGLGGEEEWVKISFWVQLCFSPAAPSHSAALLDHSDCAMERWAMLAACVLLCCSCTMVTAIQGTDMFPYGTLNGDSVLREGDDETSKVLSLPRPLYFYNCPFSQLYVSTTSLLFICTQSRLSILWAPKKNRWSSPFTCLRWYLQLLNNQRRRVVLLFPLCSMERFIHGWINKKKSGHWQQRTLGLLSCVAYSFFHEGPMFA